MKTHVVSYKLLCVNFMICVSVSSFFIMHTRNSDFLGYLRERVPPSLLLNDRAIKRIYDDILCLVYRVSQM